MYELNRFMYKQQKLIKMAKKNNKITKTLTKINMKVENKTI